jgi:hypothetical protein
MNPKIGKPVMPHPDLKIMRRILRSLLLILTVTLFQISLMSIIAAKNLQNHLPRGNQRPKL